MSSPEGGHHMSRFSRNGLFLSFALLSSASASAQILRVDASAPPGGDGLSWPSAFRDLHVAVAASRQASEVWVAGGRYVTVTGFNLPDGIPVFGGFAGTEAARDQRDPALHVTVLDGDSIGDDLPGFVNYLDNSDNVVLALGV